MFYLQLWLKINYLGINLTEVVKTLYKGSSKPLLKWTKDKIKYKHVSDSCIGRINTVKITILSNHLHWLNAVSIKMKNLKDMDPT